MRWKATIVITIIGFLLSAIFSLLLFNDEILRSRSPGIIQAMITLLFPPDDLYGPLAIESIELVDTETNRLAYQHKYPGRHEIGILLGGEDARHTFEVGTNIVLHAKIECEAGGVEYSRVIDEGSPFIGRYGSGYTLDVYNVPDDLPLDARVICEITITGLNTDFVRRQGVHRVFVEKFSDL